MKKAVKPPSLKEINAKFLRCCSSGNLDKVIEYLSLNKNSATRLSDGLKNACKKGHLPIVEHLLPLKGDVDTFEFLVKSIECNNSHISNYFFNHYTYKPDQYIACAIIASKNNNVDGFVQVLDKNDIDIHSDNELMNELIFATAIIHKSEDVLRYLIYDLDADLTPQLEKMLGNMAYGTHSDYVATIKRIFANKNLKKTLDKELIIHYEKKGRTKI